MAKKLNPFAADFEGLNKSADDKVLAMLKQAEKTNTATPKPTAVVKPEKSVPAKAVEKAVTEELQADSAKNEKKKSLKAKSTVEWGKPVAHFNTRIPEKMAELLDDLVYKLRKKGEQKTKQDLAREALQDLLRKHSVC